MGVDCYGWVEVDDPVLHERWRPLNPLHWGAVIRIDDIAGRDYDAYGFFFNVYRHPDQPVASHRGLPAQVSAQVRADSEVLGEDLTAASWILWSEVVSSHWQASITLTPGWSVLFTLMEHLAAHYGNERVRLVVWFDNDV